MSHSRERKEITKNIYRICMLFLVLTIIGSQIFLQNGLINVNANGAEEVQITDFNDFIKTNENPKLASEKTASEISFVGGDMENPFTGEELNWTEPEEYLLDLEKMGGNCSDLELEMAVHYLIPEGEGFLTFYLYLQSEYNRKGKNESTNVAYTKLFNDDLMLESMKTFIGKKRRSFHAPIEFSFIIQIKKRGKKVDCTTFKNNGEKIFHMKLMSGNFYLPIHKLIIQFDSHTYPNALEVSDINGTLTFENRDWQTLKKRADILFGFELGLIIAVVLGFLIFVIARRIPSHKSIQKSGEDKIPISKYLDRLQEGIERAKERRQNYSDEELAALTASVYEGPIEGEFCMICKLSFSEGQEILQCPLCEALYHHDHLIGWLEEKSKCPVCKEPLKEPKGEEEGI
jgi:hypothetical protein